MNYTIHAADESSAREWDSFVTGRQGWTHFHLYGWRRVITGCFSHRSDYLIAADAAGAMCGVLPLVRLRSVVFGDFMVSMPFLNYGGPLGDDEAQRALVEHASTLARERKVGLLELRCRDPRSIPLEASQRKVTVLLDLPKDGSEKLWKSLDSKLRSQIRRPIKEGVVVRFGKDVASDFFRVFARNMRDLGTPTLPARFFNKASDEFGETMWFGVAYLGDKPVAAGCGFEWNGEFEMTWASALREHNRIAPNMLLYWSFIERACQRGLACFNFGRCSPGSGTHKFKLQWNSRTEQLWWYQQSREGGSVKSTPTPDGKFSLGPRLWKHLPERVATALGPHIVRFIP